MFIYLLLNKNSTNVYTKKDDKQVSGKPQGILLKDGIIISIFLSS